MSDLGGNAPPPDWSSMTPDEIRDYYDKLIAGYQQILDSGEIPPMFEDDIKKKIRDLRDNQQRRIRESSETESIEDTREIADQLDPFRERTPEEQKAYDQAIGIVDPYGLSYYQAGDPRVVGDAERVTVDPIKSAWKGAESAFGDVTYDPNAVEGMRESSGYYRDLMRGGGRDAVSEAEYGRRVADAEQMRRAETDAALAAEEARGGSSAGARVLAEQAASAGMVSDAYRAGLDANAMAQQRRDSAARTLYDLEKGIGDTLYGADFDRASGLDAFDVSRRAGLDSVAAQNQGMQFQTGTYNADKESAAANSNWDRQNWTSDSNTDLWNQVYAGNAANRAAGTGAYMDALGIQGKQALGQGDLDLSRRKQSFEESQASSGMGMVPRVVSTVGALAEMVPYKPPERRTR